MLNANIDNFKIIGEIVFEDFGFDDKLSTNYGLENFYEIVRPHPNPLLPGEGSMNGGLCSGWALL